MEGQELYHQYQNNTSPFMIGADNWQSSSSSTTTSDNNKAPGEHFIVEEFLDFSNEDHEAGAGNDASAGGFDTSAAVDSCNSSSFSGCDPVNNYHLDVSRRNLPDGQFSGELFLPYDDMAELEWLSNIVEEESSFSSEDLQRLQLLSGIKARSTDEFSADRSTNNHDHHHNQAAVSSVPAKARSKRSRAPPCNWTSRLLLLSSDAAAVAAAAAAASEDSSSSDAVVITAPPPPAAKPAKPKKKKEQGGAAMAIGERGGEGGRRCLHCATDKTPQWRTGPMGPKTLCNACGVRYKSGRLVPEYRPAASPTFVLTKHSNSHRKVIELRRQKDVMRAHHQNNNNYQQQQQQHFVHGGMVFDHHAPPPSSSSSDHYLMIHHVPSRDAISDKSWM